MKYLNLPFTLVLITLLACSTKYQPYNSLTGFGGGYEDEAREENVYWVRYTGASSIDSEETILKLWNQRGAELCKSEPVKTEYKLVHRGGMKTGNNFGQQRQYAIPAIEGMVYCE